MDPYIEAWITMRAEAEESFRNPGKQRTLVLSHLQLSVLNLDFCGGPITRDTLWRSGITTELFF